MVIKLYKPYDKQVPIHTACNDNETFFITVNAGRQSGKSLLAINQTLYWGLSKKNQTVFWVSPTVGQATKIYKQTLSYLNTGNVILSNKGSMGDTEIVFKNGSVIKYRSGAQGDSLRGESVDYMVIDEAAFIKQDVFQSTLMQMLNVKGKKCLIVSTPKGKNWFFNHFNRGLLEEQNRYKSFKFTSADNPHSNLELIEMAKNSIPKPIFNQEYLGEFIDAATIFENVNELSVMTPTTIPTPTDKYFIGIDIGMMDDSTVVTVLNHKSEMVYYWRKNNINSTDIKTNIQQIITMFNPVKTFLELNNQGLPIYQDLVELGVRSLQGFQTTEQSKNEIINNLINAFSSKTIKVLDDEYLKSELTAFTMIPQINGKVKFSAPNGFNDDCVMSLAIALHCLNKNQFNGSYNFISA